MRIGFWLEDKDIDGVDLSNPECGNPGIGGTQYMFVLLTYYLNKLFPDLEILLFRYNDNKIFPGVRCIKIKNHILECVEENKIDIFVFGTLGRDDNFYKKLNLYKFKSIAWAHNYISMSDAKSIELSHNIKRLVFVGHQEYDRYIDHNVINKSTYIYNMFNSDVRSYIRSKNYGLNVTYTGSLTEAKGFHVLAKGWKYIIKKVPNATLHVIGGGNLYNKSQELGKYKIASKEYEEKFIKYLVDDYGNILPSVVFHGVLGQEKINIYQNTAVGIINPTGLTETFGISAVEMEACGIPIVTKKAFGLCDVVKHKKTGLLSRRETVFYKNIVKLLINRDLNISLGSQAKEFVKEEFNPEKISKQWYDLFVDIINNKQNEILPPTFPYIYDFKWIRIIISYAKKLPFGNKIIAFNELTYMMRSKMKLWKKKILMW